MKNKKIIIFTFVIMLLIFIMSGCYLYLLNNTYYSIGINEYLISNENISVVKEDDGILFDGPGKDKLLIFYPGALVTSESYSKLLYNLSLNGIDCYAVDFPLNIAFFGKNKADKIIDKYDYYKSYYIGGHSLGGVLASRYANNNLDTISGVVLLASYPDVKLDNSLKLISVYGSDDGVLNSSKYEINKKNWPENSVELEIIGGNHSGFANYGHQKNDKYASISSDLQQEKTIDFIMSTIGS